MRYVYLGDRHTRPELVGQPCDPVVRPDGKCVVGGSKQLVVFADGTEVVVMRRRLRIVRPVQPAEAASTAELPLKYDRHEDCPDAAKRHTKAPTGYLERESWAERKSRRHVQTQCPTCGYWVVWKRRKPGEELPWLAGPAGPAGPAQPPSG